MWSIKCTPVVLLLLVVAYGVCFPLQLNLDDAGLTTEEQVKKYGYPYENHFVTTADGYILTVQRIPRKSPQAQVILLMPGILRSSEMWVNFGPERSLGFILSDAGYDVWMGNYRGTTWSRRHKTLDPDLDTKKFWNYSMDELGNYDCPAVIDYILNATAQKDLIYFGETVSASMFYIMAAEKPAYASKVKLMIAVAPMIIVGPATFPLYTIVAKTKNQMQKVADYFEQYELLQRTVWSKKLGIMTCSNVILLNVCDFFHGLGVGFNPSQLNRTAIPLLLNAFPAGISLKLLRHIVQNRETGVFAKYDYGLADNMKVYGQPTPKIYDLSKINTPTAVYYGGNDALVNKQGVEKALPLLRHVVLKKYMKDFSNGDFFWGKDVVKLIYLELLQFMKTYAN